MLIFNACNALHFSDTFTSQETFTCSQPNTRPPYDQCWYLTPVLRFTLCVHIELGVKKSPQAITLKMSKFVSFQLQTWQNWPAQRFQRHSLQQRRTNSNMAAFTTSTRMCESMTDIIIIPTTNLKFLTMACSKRVSLGNSNNDWQPKIAIKILNTFISVTTREHGNSKGKSGIYDHVQLEKCRQMTARATNS